MRLSYSSIDTYERCPAAFKFHYEDRLPGKPSPALAFGDSLHRALQRFHNRPVPIAPALRTLVHAGRLGRSTGAGFFEYDA